MPGGKMGLSLATQCNLKLYFSLSTINKDLIKEYGLNMTVKQLREKARKTAPFQVLYTGDDKFQGRQRKTYIWRYEDFKTA